MTPKVITDAGCIEYENLLLEPKGLNKWTVREVGRQMPLLTASHDECKRFIWHRVYLAMKSKDHDDRT